ncbi:hypothetical protein [Amycolatopsis minnesotensis]|uniref:Uncharacterized protein n=1 Tax=Amycolatopsis minnesotensis TaxID=337894 RepID=A0ABN2SV79_9PSEU
MTVYCSYANTPHYGVGTAWFTVLDPNPPHTGPSTPPKEPKAPSVPSAPSARSVPSAPQEPKPGKQVTKVPVGAAQTGDGTLAVP